MKIYCDKIHLKEDKMINIPIKVAWFCDWNGYEVGFDEVEVVGLYSFQDYDGCHYSMYVDVERNEILEVWADEEDDEWN